MPLTSLTLSDCRVVEAGNCRSSLGTLLTGATRKLYAEEEPALTSWITDVS